LKPLIKWTGGKSNELRHIKPMIPKFVRYIEPFFGGGALFFNIMPQKAIINDIIPELISFYKLIKCEDKDFKIELYQYASSWTSFTTYFESFLDDLLNIYFKYRDNHFSFIETTNHLDALFEEKNPILNDIFPQKFIMDFYNFQEKIRINLKTRFKNLHGRIDVEGKLTIDELSSQFETAFRAGFYTHFREIHNKRRKNLLRLTTAKYIANYYFLREFCFGGMFRHNNSGGFNIPYGGMNYNRKNLKRKVDNIFSPKVSKLFKSANIKNDDFERIIETSNLTEEDFMFLDPPYDSKFNDYDENCFSRNDQIRLRNILLNTKSKFILLIKETDFIRKIYKKQDVFRIKSFEKLYASNIKSRYDRKANHLIIYNYDFS